MPSQRQIRGAATVVQEARTLVARELDIDTTEKRLHIHDGTTVGGIPIPNYVDMQDQIYVYGGATGTNALSITVAKAPTTYQTGQRFTFKAAATCTGGVTLNVNSLGAKTIKKKDVATGAVVALVAGDIIIGGAYGVTVTGTDFIIDSVDSGALTSVSSGDFPLAAQGAAVLTFNEDTTTPTKVFAWHMPYTGTVKTTFKMTNTNPFSGLFVTARFYKNGTATGTLRSLDTGTPVTYIEDISVTAGDELQLYLTDNTAFANTSLLIANLKISCAEFLPAIAVEEFY